MSDATLHAADPFAELKLRQAAAWSAAPFERLADTMAEIHDRLVEGLAPRRGERWLDVAAGTAPVAVRAARAGATVTALDLAPALVQTARRLAAAEGLQIRVEVGDCERLPYPNASFDVVASALGVIFAPNHAAVARELARVVRPGGRLGLASWQPDGGAARMTGLVASFAPGPPPSGAGNLMDWGREDYVRTRLSGAFELSFVGGDAPHAAPSAEALWQFYLGAAGPMKAIVDGLGPDRREALHGAFVALADAHRHGDGIRFPREYLLVFGTRRHGPAP